MTYSTRIDATAPVLSGVPAAARRERVERLMALARGLRCVGLLLVYLIPERRTVWWKVCGREGERELDWQVRATETSTSCNDATRVEGANAFLPLASMRTCG